MNPAALPGRYQRLRSALRLVVGLPMLLLANPAHADDVHACFTSHEQGQVLRRSGALREAIETLDACTQSHCPGPVQRDCALWRSEIAATIPTVVLAISDPSGEALPGRAFFRIDDDPTWHPIDGLARTTDPGEHQFAFRDASGRVVTRRFVVLEGVKNQTLRAEFEPLHDDDDALPATFWVAGGLGIVGLASFGILGGIGLSQEGDLRDRCQGRCPQDDVDDVQRLYTVADIVGVIGIVGVGAATTIAIVDSSKTNPSRVQTRLGIGSLSVTVSF